MTAAEKISIADDESWILHLTRLPVHERRTALKSRGGQCTTAEAALFLGISIRTLYNLIHEELGPKHLKKGESKTGRGGRAFFEISDLEKWDAGRVSKKEAYR